MTSLKNLSDRDLLNRLNKLVRQEHDVTLDIVRHLVEVERRGLYAANAYSSLFEYCRVEFGYSDASAWRRAGAAMAIYRCPEALDLLEKRQVTITALAKISKFVTPDLLKKICGKSREEVELIASAHSPKSATHDKTRPVMVARKVPDVDCDNTGRTQDPGPGAPTAAGKPPALRADGEATGDLGESPLRGEVELTNIKLSFEQKWKVEGVVSERVKKKLDKCKSLLSSKYPSGVDYDSLFDELTEVFLDKTDPERRIERRKKRNSDNNKSNKTSTATREQKNRTRYIPAIIKDEVWAKHNGRCAFVGTNGKRCTRRIIYSSIILRAPVRERQPRYNKLRVWIRFHSREAGRVPPTILDYYAQNTIAIQPSRCTANSTWTNSTSENSQNSETRATDGPKIEAIARTAKLGLLMDPKSRQ